MFDPIHMNLTSAGGEANGVLTDSVVQEIDIKTGLVMWEWHALGHVALSESNNPAPKASYPWDYVHINSISPPPAIGAGGVGANQPGDVLLSSRSTWTLYDVDLHTGGIVWRLGGDHSSFRLGAGVRTYWQHDAEWQPGGLISVFDNGSDPPKEKQSRGLLLDPNTSNHTVTLVKQFTNPSKTLLAESQGNLLESVPSRKHVRQLADGLRRAAELHRVRPRRPRAARRNARQERAELSHLPRSHGAARRRACPRWRWRARRSRRAGTGPRTSPPGGCSGAPRRAPSHRSQARRRPVSRRRSRCRSSTAYVAVQALDASGAVLATSPTRQGLTRPLSRACATAFREALRSRPRAAAPASWPWLGSRRSYVRIRGRSGRR